jgi:hypothetical protein
LVYFNCIVIKLINGFVLWYMFLLKWPDNLNTLVIDKLIFLLVVFIWLWSKFIPVLKYDKQVLIFDCLESGQLSTQWTLFPHARHLPGLFLPTQHYPPPNIHYCIEFSLDAFSSSQTLFFFQLSIMHDSILSWRVEISKIKAEVNGMPILPHKKRQPQTDLRTNPDIYIYIYIYWFSNLYEYIYIKLIIYSYFYLFKYSTNKHHRKLCIYTHRIWN